MQFLGIASVAGLVSVAGIGAASTLRKQPEITATSEGTVALSAKPPVQRAAPAAAPVVVQQAARQVAAPADTTAAQPAPAPVSATRSGPRGGFVLVAGKTQLTDSIYAMRDGDSVVVNFDAFGYRTRRFDKFEQTLRETLPLVFGKMATAGLDTLKKGELLTNHDVVRSLASQGMVLTLGNGASVRIRALTRDVRDGPIAIGYLTTIER